MIFTAPLPFNEALDAREVKSLLPTTGNTADFAKLASAVKERAMFSATVTSGELLQKIDDMVNGVLTGQLDQATARLQIKELLADMGYVPDPEKAGGLQDLSSTRRIDLQLETNVDTARGYGWWAQGQQEDVLDEFPGDELIRLWEPKGGPSAERDWAERWAEVGGQFIDGRMVALKNDPIWEELGSPDNFPDGIGNPYPPFAFNSGMGTRDIGRDDAEGMGLLDKNSRVFPKSRGFNEDLQAKPDVRDARLVDMMEDAGVGSFGADGVFQFESGGNQ
ncbi:MAG TPA: hypothetical protein VFE25_08260 [Opitutaceae bacterium]|jgi:hypothetical protein|nr:hypothetical protein [Opitutaceae bacterium]